MNVTEESLGALTKDLDTARATVFVAAEALDHGESDLELQSAVALKSAFRLISEVYSSLCVMRIEAYSEQNPDGGLS